MAAITTTTVPSSAVCMVVDSDTECYSCEYWQSYAIKYVTAALLHRPLLFIAMVIYAAYLRNFAYCLLYFVTSWRVFVSNMLYRNVFHRMQCVIYMKFNCLYLF